MGGGRWPGSPHPTRRWGARRSNDAIVVLSSSAWCIGSRPQPVHPRGTSPSFPHHQCSGGACVWICSRRIEEPLRVLIHVGKTKIWNRAGNRPVICDALERMAQQVDPRARFGEGHRSRPTNKASKCSVSRQLQTVLNGGAAHSLEPNPQGGRAERVADSVALCVGTCQLPHPCFAPRSNVSVRSHLAGLWQCLCSILQMDPVQFDTVRETATVPFVSQRFGRAGQTLWR